MTFRHLRSFICFAMLAYCASPASAAILFSDDFDGYGAGGVAVTTTSTSGNYSVAVSLANNNKATFGYDYGAAGLGIPAQSSGGTTLALRLDPNNGGTATIGALAVSPTASFPGDYEIKYDLWMNSIAGGAGVTWNGGGTGSSEGITTGVGYNGTTTQFASSGSGVWFDAMGDGGFAGTSATPDYEVRVGTTLQATSTGVYSAGLTAGNGGAQDNANSYYTTAFPGQATPAGQTPVATADNGTLLFKWHTVRVARIGNVVSWNIDGTQIAAITDASATATNRIFVGSWDPATSQDAGRVFALIDNLTITEVPEPASCILVALGMAAVGLVARRRRGA